MKERCMSFIYERKVYVINLAEKQQDWLLPGNKTKFRMPWLWYISKCFQQFVLPMSIAIIIRNRLFSSWMLSPFVFAYAHIFSSPPFFNITIGFHAIWRIMQHCAHTAQEIRIDERSLIFPPEVLVIGNVVFVKLF